MVSTMHPTTAMPPTIAAPEPQGWCENNTRNKPQSNSVGAASLVFYSGGMSIAWSFGYNFRNIPDLHLQICWFIAAILGALISVLITNIVRRKKIYYLSVLLLAISGIFWLAIPNLKVGLIFARYLDGLANGLIVVPALILIGEESVKSKRGMLAAAVEPMCISLGFATQLLLHTLWTPLLMNGGRVQGIIIMINCVLGVMIIKYLFVESPIYYLLRNEEDKAIDCVRKLQYPAEITTETYEIILDHKNYIESNNNMEYASSIKNSLAALLAVCFYRSLTALTFSRVIPYTIAVTRAFTLRSKEFDIIIGFVRFVSMLIVAFLVDYTGRKRLILIGGLFIGCIFIAIGVLFSDSLFSALSEPKMTAVFCLLCVGQIFSAIFTVPVSAYMCEAFPLALKSYYIFIVYASEMLMQIIVISCTVTVSGLFSYYLAVGILILLLVIIGHFVFPETKNLSLLDAMQKFMHI